MVLIEHRFDFEVYCFLACFQGHRTTWSATSVIICLDSSAAGVLVDGLGALRDGVLRELTREEEAHRGLDLTGGEGRAVGVAAEAEGLVGQTIKGVVDKRVHDGHGAAGNSDIRVHLLEHLVDVGGEGFDTALAALLVVGRLLGRRLRRGLGRRLGHSVVVQLQRS